MGFSALLLASGASAKYTDPTAVLRDYLRLDDVERSFRIDEKNEFRSWTLDQPRLINFLEAKYPELEDSLCFRKLLVSPEHVIRSSKGVRMESLGVSEFVSEGRVSRVDLLPHYGPGAGETLPSLPVIQCPVRKPEAAE